MKEEGLKIVEQTSCQFESRTLRLEFQKIQLRVMETLCVRGPRAATTHVGTLKVKENMGIVTCEVGSHTFFNGRIVLRGFSHAL